MSYENHPAFKNNDDRLRVAMRAEFAKAAMNALLSDPSTITTSAAKIAELSVGYADALIAELNKE